MIQQLLDGAARLGLSLTRPQAEALVAYLDLIQKWNKVYNLTAVREPTQMLTHHLLDSLAVVAPLLRQLAGLAYARDGADDNRSGPAFRVLDVGSGAGLPGIVIAICCPQIQVDCVDTVAKKAAFISQVAVTLKLPNLRGLHSRVENLGGAAGGAKYDVVCSRAFATLADFTDWSAGALAEGGVWMAMKGKQPADEVVALGERAPAIEVFHVEQLAVPGLDADRCIVWMRKMTK